MSLQQQREINELKRRVEALELGPFSCAKCGIPSRLDPIAGQDAHDKGSPHDHHPIRPVLTLPEKRKSA